MGSKTILPIIFIIVLFASCECPKTKVAVYRLGDEHKIWFSKSPNKDSIIIVRSTTGLADYLKFTISDIENGTNDIYKGSGQCTEYEGFEMYSANYHSLIAGTYWHFNFSTSTKQPELRIAFNKNAGGYTSCSFYINLNNINALRDFSYYPYDFTQSEGFVLVGDSMINGNTYNDICRFDLVLNQNVKPLDVVKIVLSKTRGLVAYQTYNNVIWQLQF